MLVFALLLVSLAPTTGAAGTTFSAPENVFHLREIQRRDFDATAQDHLLKTVMATMQDLEFVLDDTEPALGVVTGTKIGGGFRLRLSVFIRPVGTGRYAVRASAHRGHIAIEDPRVYQDFFDALGVVMALP